MNKTIAAVVLLIGLLILGGVKYFTIEKSNDLTVTTSDAKSIQHTIRIGVDSWAGYYPLCSRYFKSSLRNEGIRLTCENDNADMDMRLNALRKNELEFAVSTVDAYLSLGAKYQFPGTIVTVIDESKGGDALICQEQMVDNINDLKSNPSLRVALTKDSPSEHLLRSLAVHFDVDTFKHRGSWLVATAGSEDALRRLKSGEVDCAVLWEPDVTKASQLPGTKKIIGTEDTEKLIVDVLLASRTLINKQPELVQQVLSIYYDTLKYYRENPGDLVDEMSRASGLKENVAQKMLEGVKWATLTENAMDWFSSVGSNRTEYLIESINSGLNILRETAVLSSNPLPNGDPYVLTNSVFVTELFNKRIGHLVIKAGAENVGRQFSALTVEQWDTLREVGTLKVRNVQFPRSASDLSLDAKRMLDDAASDLSHYPNFRILIKGHSGTGGDAEANRALSFSRAKTVQRYFNIIHGIDETRMLATGVGSDEPLSKRPDEGQRAYRARLPRVELILKAGVL